MAVKGDIEAVVIGAGPAGLGTALSLAREGVKVAILEKQDEVGLERRGETIRFDKEMDSLLRGGFFAKQKIRTIRNRTYYSHTGLQEVSREISNPNIIINWTSFLQAMADILNDEGVYIYTSSEVTGFFEEKGCITGVKAIVNGSEEDLKATAVFSCGGHKDPASRYLKTDRSDMDLPVFKQLVTGYTGPSDRLEYFFHIEDGYLAVSTIFPRSAYEAEFILMGYPLNSGKQISLEGFCEEHPNFKERISGTNPIYTLESFIPMGEMLRKCSPKPGLVMVGDAMGHVQARGGSGIKASFMIGYTAGKLSAEAIKSGRWSKMTSFKLNQDLEKSSALRSLRKHNLLFSNLRPLLFKGIRTPEEMDNYWPALKHALR